MTVAEDGPEEFRPPTALESAVRALGADTIRYRADYIMLPMRDGIRLATVVFRPRAEGRYPTLLVRSPYAAAIPGQFKPMHTAQFKKNYVLIMQNERGSEWSEGDFGILTITTADAQDTLDWISAQEWSNGRVGLHGCSSTAENQLKLGAIGHPALRACVPMSSGAGVGDIPGAEGSNGGFFRGGVPMIKTWALWYGPYGVRQRPKLPADAEGDELARIFRQYSVSAPDFRSPEYTAALDKATLQAPSGDILRRMGSPLTGYETFMAGGPASPAWKVVDLIDASHTGATPTSPCTTDTVTSRRCTSAPTPARSRSTRQCPIPGPAAGRDGLIRERSPTTGPAIQPHGHASRGGGVCDAILASWTGDVPRFR